MKTTLSIIILLFTLYADAQQTATTDDGKTVLLHDNGKWEYAKDVDSSAEQAKLKSFTKPATSITLVKSEKNNFAVWYDNKKWKKTGDLNNDAAEFSFTLLKGDGYAMAITERIEIDIANLKEVALTNARNAAPDITLEKEETRIVNGKKVKCLQMTGTASGVKFTYLGYYYSDESGTIQLVCFTGKSLLKTYQKDFEELLNGLVTIQK